MIQGRWKTGRAAASHTSSSPCWHSLVTGLLAMVVVGVITVGEIKEFDVFVAPRGWRW